MFDSELNRLQATTVREQMRELFVELCLTVPVRLSSLLPYLPLLMDPLVCALNGSPTLLQQVTYSRLSVTHIYLLLFLFVNKNYFLHSFFNDNFSTGSSYA